MKNKKVIIISLSVVFAVAILLVIFFTFSVRRVDVSFATYSDDREEYSEVKDELYKLKGKNLLFFSEKDITSIVEKNPYLQVKTVKKNFPDTLNIEITESLEVYNLSYEGKDYIISESGKVLSDQSAKEGLIELELENVKINSVNLGKSISVDCQFSLDNAFNILKEHKLSDRIKTMKVEKCAQTAHPEKIGEKQTKITYGTFTGVDVIIWDADDDGVKKAGAVFGLFDSVSDYEKSCFYFEVDKINGEIVATFTKNK